MERTNQEMRESLKEKKRIVIKVGSASITHKETGSLDLRKIEKLVRVISDLNAEGKDVILVSSGAIATGRSVIGMHRRPRSMAEKQAFAAIGQARLMMTYQKIFSEYSVIASQVLLTKNIMLDPRSRENATNTFLELLNLGTVPVVNENDTVSTSEINQVESFGDNDQLAAARISTDSGADMVIARFTSADVITEILDGENVGTLFAAHENKDFDLVQYLESEENA